MKANNLIGKLELEVLRHIQNYRITVPLALARLYEISVEQATEILTSLHTKRFVGSAELMPDEKYFFLQPLAAGQLGSPKKLDTGPVIATVKIQAYATLYFCCLAGDYKPKIPTNVFQTRFARLYRSGPKINYYTDGPNIGYIRVETAASLTGDVFRLIERCRRDINKRTSSSKKNGSQFKELLEAGRFKVTVLTAFPQKAQRVQAECNRMTERYLQYMAHVDAKAAGFKRTPKHHFVEYNRWHHKNPDRKPPVPPPPMEIIAVPRLIDLIYPKAEHIA